jgi:protein SCO1/2
MMKKYGIWLFVVTVVVVPFTVFAVVKWYEQNYTKLPVLGPQGHTIADFKMKDQYGTTTSSKAWDNKIVVADFFFTHCPVVCPKMTRSLKNVQQLYAGDAELLITSFTVDPQRDSSAELLSYAKKMDIRDNWLLLTGDKKEIYRLARKSFLVVATDGDGGPDDFIHSELLVLVDKEKRIRGYYNGTDKADVEQLLLDIKRLKREY